jgi:hypothetical protein
MTRSWVARRRAAHDFWRVPGSGQPAGADQLEHSAWSITPSLLHYIRCSACAYPTSFDLVGQRAGVDPTTHCFCFISLTGRAAAIKSASVSLPLFIHIVHLFNITKTTFSGFYHIIIEKYVVQLRATVTTARPNDHSYEVRYICFERNIWVRLRLFMELY